MMRDEWPGGRTTRDILQHRCIHFQRAFFIQEFPDGRGRASLAWSATPCRSPPGCAGCPPPAPGCCWPLSRSGSCCSAACSSASAAAPGPGSAAPPPSPAWPCSPVPVRSAAWAAGTARWPEPGWSWRAPCPSRLTPIVLRPLSAGTRRGPGDRRRHRRRVRPLPRRRRDPARGGARPPRPGRLGGARVPRPRLHRSRPAAVELRHPRRGHHPGQPAPLPGAGGQRAGRGGLPRRAGDPGHDRRRGADPRQGGWRQHRAAALLQIKTSTQNGGRSAPPER